jgi:hypothetical protein
VAEAGLPMQTLDIHGEQALLTGAKGVVRAVHPERRRVDIETEDGSLLTEVLVIGPYFPEVHVDAQAPSHVVYLHARGQPDAFCWPTPHRRLLGPQDSPKDAGGQEQPERRYFHTHGYIFRHGDVTVRLTDDNRYVIETEQGDYIILDTQQRQIRLHAPHVFVGTDDEAQANRVEFEQDESFRAFNPLILLGTETGDRIEYRDKAEIILQAPIIKITANEVIVDPVSIKLGNENANEPLVLGNTWLALYNAFIALFNSHQHTNVQTGGGLSGPPQTASPGMTSAQLSDIAYVSKDGL